MNSRLRWTLRILLVLLALTLVAAGGIQLLLRSEWLARRILTQASARLGMDVNAGSFSTGWGGTTTLRDVTVRMPLDREVIAAAGRVKLGHTAVVPLLFGRPLRLQSVELQHPVVSLREYESGRWNAQDALVRIRALITARRPERRAARLPQIVVHEGAVRVTESGGATQTVSPIEFEGRGPGRPLWLFNLQASSLVRLHGRLSPGDEWSHEVAFGVADLGPLVRAVFARELAPIQATGRWTGRVRQGAWDGALALEQLVLGPAVLHGMAQVTARPERVIIEPCGLNVSEPNVAGEPIQLTTGTVEITRERAVWNTMGVQVGAVGGQTQGYWDRAARRAELSGSWAAAWPAHSAQAHGAWRASLASPRQGRKEAEASLTAQAQTPLGLWRCDADLRGAGTAWQTSQWRIQVPLVAWSRGESRLDVTGVTAGVDLQWPAIQLVSLDLPQAKEVDAAARFDADTRRWSVRLALEQLRAAILGPDGLDLRLNAEGDRREARVSEFRLAQGEKVATASGGISFLDGELENAHVAANWAMPASGSGPAAAAPPVGRWRLETQVAGHVRRPVALTASGVLTGQNIALGRRQVERVAIPVHATMDARQVRLATEPFDLLGGQWEASGRHQFVGRWTRLSIMVADLSLEAAAGMAGLPLASRGRGEAEVQLVMPGFDLHRATASGRWNAQDVDISPFAAEQAHGSLRIAEGLVRLEDIQLEQQGGSVLAGLEFRLDRPQVLSVDVRTEAWPLRFAGDSWTVQTDAQAHLRLDVIQRTAEGQARVAARTVWDGRTLGDLNLAVSVRGRTLDVRELHAAGLGGTLDGTARVPLDRWTSSVARLRWQGIEPHRLAAWLPALEPFQGVVSGSLAVEQTQGQARAPEPLRLVLDVNAPGAGFGAGTIDGGRLVVYLGPMRLLVEEAWVRALGSRLHARARVSRHQDRYSGLVAADFNDLSLDQLVHVFAPEAGAYPGLLSGSITVLSMFPLPRRPTDLVARGGAGSPAGPGDPTPSPAPRLSGEARLRLTESDLVNNRIVQTLYNTLSLRFGRQEPTGSGEVRVRLEGPAAVISSFTYFNRGVEIRGAGTIADLTRRQSLVDGYAVASTRILKGLQLPGARELDRLLSSLQTGAASVRIAGTLDDVQVRVVPFPEVLGAFRNLLWAQLRE